MNQVVKEYLENFEMGEGKTHNNMTVFPIFTNNEKKLEYITLQEALENRELEIREITEGGSVPELKVLNKGKKPVLLIDGEEISGAKQNRIINTSILLKEESETIIPVSCTEQGRWSYETREFYNSDIVASLKLRRKKSTSVSESLEREKSYRADQGEVWDEVDAINSKAHISSPTMAMKHSFMEKKDELDEYINKYEHLKDQKGMMVFINGKVAGFDVISLAEAYEKLHKKLLKSYSIEAMFERTKVIKDISENEAKDFIKKAMNCAEKKFASVGYGWDYRYTSKTVAGSALLYKEVIPHTAFFRIEQNERIGRMTGLYQRRGYRM